LFCQNGEGEIRKLLSAKSAAIDLRGVISLANPQFAKSIAKAIALSKRRG